VREEPWILWCARIKGIVICEASRGNNEIVAETIVEIGKDSGFGVDLLDMEKLERGGYDFLVVGGADRSRHDEPNGGALCRRKSELFRVEKQAFRGLWHEFCGQ
jgi:menaquinone-dependent protoporphyrinogen IX oxidase